MEREYRAVQAECEELQSVLDQKEDQLCSLSQELVDLSHRMQVSAQLCCSMQYPCQNT